MGRKLLCLLGFHDYSGPIVMNESGGAYDTYETWEILTRICPRCNRYFSRKVFTV